jgi:toxin HigB-1
LRYYFRKKKLQALFTDEKGSEKYPAEVVTAFFDVMASLAAAVDERDIRKLKSLHYEKLSGGRKGQHSVRLNKQWRLVIEVEEDKAGKLLAILSIEDYH